MDVAVALVDAGAAEGPGLLRRAPRRRIADLIDGREHASPDRGPAPGFQRSSPARMTMAVQPRPVNPWTRGCHQNGRSSPHQRRPFNLPRRDPKMTVVCQARGQVDLRRRYQVLPYRGYNS